MVKPSIIFVCGFAGAGKSTIGKELAKVFHAAVHEVSSCVGDALGTQDRKEKLLESYDEVVEREGPNWLGKRIEERALETFWADKFNVVLFLGLREKDPFLYLTSLDYDVSIIWLDATETARWTRLVFRDEGKIADAEKRDIKERKVFGEDLAWLRKHAKFVLDTSQGVFCYDK